MTTLITATPNATTALVGLAELSAMPHLSAPVGSAGSASAIAYQSIVVKEAEWQLSVITSGTACQSGHRWLNKAIIAVELTTTLPTFALTIVDGAVAQIVRQPQQDGEPGEPYYRVPSDVAALYALKAPRPLQDAAKALRDRAKECGASLPRPRLADDGIMFYARKGSIYLDLGVREDGMYSFYCRDAEGDEFVSDDDIAVTEALDENVCRVLKELA